MLLAASGDGGPAACSFLMSILLRLKTQKIWPLAHCKELSDDLCRIAQVRTRLWKGRGRNCCRTVTHLLLHSHPPVVTKVGVCQSAHRGVPQEGPPGDLVTAVGDCGIRPPGNTFQLGSGLRISFQDAALDVLKPGSPGNACMECQVTL